MTPSVSANKMASTYAYQNNDNFNLYGEAGGGSRWFSGTLTIQDGLWACPTGCGGSMRADDSDGWWLTDPEGFHHQCSNCGFRAALSGIRLDPTHPESEQDIGRYEGATVKGGFIELKPKPKGFSDFKRIICLDFDGVVHEYKSKWVSSTVISDRMVPGTIEFIESAWDNGFDVAIFSSRSGDAGGIDTMRRWLHAELVSAKKTHEEAAMFVDRLSFPTDKPPAFLSIDDRAWNFNGVYPSIEIVKSFKPWNK